MSAQKTELEIKDHFWQKTQCLTTLCIWEFHLGGISLGNVFGKNINRVQQTNGPVEKKGDTVCRVLVYPSINTSDVTKASVGFYDLTSNKNKSNDAKLNMSDEEAELGERSISVTNADGLVEVPEDIYDTEGVFNEIINQTVIYDIITVIDPPIKYKTLILATKPVNNQLVLFEGAGKNKKTKRKQRKNKKTKRNNKTK